MVRGVVARVRDRLQESAEYNREILEKCDVHLDGECVGNEAPQSLLKHLTKTAIGLLPGKDERRLTETEVRIARSHGMADLPPSDALGNTKVGTWLRQRRASASPRSSR